MSAIHHLRRQSSTRSTAPKAARSAPSSKSATTPRSTAKAARLTISKQEDNILAADDEDMATTFLQYWCRRQDASSPANQPHLSLLLASPFRTPPKLPASSNPYGEPLRSYLPAFQPTPPPHSSTTPPMHHNGKSDLDPTEWKPADLEPGEGTSPPFSQVSVSSGSRKTKLQHCPSSEAFNFSSKFTPSLSHTPRSSEESLIGTPYDFVNRPVVSGTISKQGEGLQYEKQIVTSGLGSASGSLRNLLGSHIGEN